MFTHPNKPSLLAAFDLVLGIPVENHPLGRVSSGQNLTALQTKLAFGIPAALFTGRLMTSLLFHESSYDPWAFSGAILLLAICAAVAGFIPARRTASIDPMGALRTE
jgi:ABC-type lipoprotein release transport system permease subunit